MSARVVCSVLLGLATVGCTRKGSTPAVPPSDDDGAGSLQHNGSIQVRRLSKSERTRLFQIAEAVGQRYEEVGWQGLSPAEQTFHTVWWVEAEVNHGGFEYYYFNSFGDQALDAPGALLIFA